MYSLVLVTRWQIKPDDFTQFERIDGRGLLTTCHLINAEACDILYGKNIFHFDDCWESVYGDLNHVANMNSIYSFLKDIGNRNRLRLRHIELLFQHRDFLFYPDEEWFLNHNRRSYSHARILGRALQLLARGHALRSLGIEIEAINNKDTGEVRKDYIDYPSWPAFMASKKLKQYFLDLKGINEVSIYVECYRNEDVNSIKAFQREMENSAP